jgi:tetratricopeptide (TPR) repeat protein
MASKKQPTKKDEINQPVGETNETSQQVEKIDLETEYQKMLNEFQQGDWAACKKILERLEKQFPDEKKLKDFRNDFDLQYAVSRNSSAAFKEKKKITFVSVKPKLKSIGVIAAGVTILALLVLMIVLLIQQKAQREKIDQINSLGSQVEALLNSSQPDKAKAIIEVMRGIDPENETVLTLASRTDDLLMVETQYQAALEYIDAGNFSEAKVTLQQIKVRAANYKNVSLLLDEVTKKVELQEALIQGEEAFNNGDWQVAIDNLELVVTLDPTYSDQAFKDMLLNSYLHRIIQMLDSTTSSINDIDLAESYYKRALAMIPQSKAYQSERENLQKVSRDLLELQYAQTAYAMVADPTQTVATVNEALSYLKKAANLDSTNSTLQDEVNKMTLYQAGVQYYIDMDWTSAAQQFSALIAMDDGYADGMARQLLFESYIGRGVQFYNVGFYGDARIQFEAAEALMWDGDNVADLYIARVELGRALVKLEDYKNASSYFKYAVESIHYLSFSSTALEAVDGITTAINYHDIGQYEKACEGFVLVLKDDPFQDQVSVKGQEGQLLAAIAEKYNSTAQMIIRANLLTQQTVLTSDQDLVIPTFND